MEGITFFIFGIFTGFYVAVWSQKSFPIEWEEDMKKFKIKNKETKNI